MKIFPHTPVQANPQNRLIHSLFFSLFTSASLVLSTLSLPAHAQNQSFNNTQITNYAQALLTMEPARQQAFGQIKKIVGNGDVPKIVCNEPNSMNSLPEQAKNIAINYCNYSQKIVSDNGLTITQFNNITMEIQSNNGLKQQVYDTLIRLQKNTNTQ